MNAVVILIGPRGQNLNRRLQTSSANGWVGRSTFGSWRPARAQLSQVNDITLVPTGWDKMLIETYVQTVEKIC